MKRKILLSILVLVLLIILINSGTVQAALQSNGGGAVSYNLETWLRNVRSMESLGGTLGLQDTINGTNLTSSASEKNNIDIHMEKNTEYGAMAILSASSYGNQNVITDGQTTTGNKTGIYMRINKEWVSGGNVTAIGIWNNMNGKYKNQYTSTYVAKAGDAISETAGWHENGTSISEWIRSGGNIYQGYYEDTEGILRAYGNSIFTYYCLGRRYNYSASDSYFDATYNQAHPSRAVIVCGNGF